jgi:hypothetical protein
MVGSVAYEWPESTEEQRFCQPEWLTWRVHDPCAGIRHGRREMNFELHLRGGIGARGHGAGRSSAAIDAN